MNKNLLNLLQRRRVPESHKPESCRWAMRPEPVPDKLEPPINYGVCDASEKETDKD